MVKNYAKYTFYITFIVVIILLVIRLFNPFEIAGYKFKDIDILSDLQQTPPTLKKFVATSPHAAQLKKEPCEKGVTCIEDYSPNGQAMLAFISALNSAKTENVRVAFLGDSFIEGDIITEDFREKMQVKFGGTGVGYAPITEELTGCRKSLIIRSKNIDSYWLISRCRENEVGIGGNYYYPQSGATFSYKTSRFRAHIDTFYVSRLMYLNRNEGTKLSYSINRTDEETIELPASSQISIAEVRGKIGFIRYNVTNNTGVKLYGTYLDSPTGVCVDNYAMRGNSGLKLLSIPDATLKQIDSLLHYKLIVLQYGLNACGETTTNYDWYIDKMNIAIQKIKRCFPKSSILLLGVGDRCMRKNGEYVTMPGIINLLNEQRQMAIDNQIAFWSIFDAMGGENSMNKFVKDGNAAKDFTHLSFSGGRVIGNKLFDAVMTEKTRYEKREIYK